MALRNNRALKLLSILLFAFGLAAPAFAPVTPELEIREYHRHIADLDHHATFNQLLCEEIGSEEEREVKDHKPHFSFALYFITQPGILDQVSVSGTHGYTSSPIQKLRAHPSLFRLHRTLLI